MKIFEKDLDFLQQRQQVVVLEEQDKRVLVSPAYQGRVMTSSADGDRGHSFGWINYDLIDSGKPLKHCNNYGGEDRFWIGPEGGQYSIFFKPGADFSLENWQTPSPIDTEPWALQKASKIQATFSKAMTLANYAGHELKLMAEREVRLFSDKEINERLTINIPSDVQAVGFGSINKMTNAGDFEWTKQTGMLSVWILGQFVSAGKNTAVLPFKPDTPGEIVNDSYFGKVGSDRLKILDKAVLFKADGNRRGKIGIGPARAIPLIGSYDGENNLLTLVKCSFGSGKRDYVNSMWEHQQEPWKGDVVNAYNDGPLDDGTQMGPFYELETSSPAAALKPGETLRHEHQTYHFAGTKTSLEKIAFSTLGVDLVQCF